MAVKFYSRVFLNYFIFLMTYLYSCDINDLLFYKFIQVKIKSDFHDLSTFALINKLCDDNIFSCIENNKLIYVLIKV